MGKKPEPACEIARTSGGEKKKTKFNTTAIGKACSLTNNQASKKKKRNKK